MTTIDHRILIPAPPDVVWEYVSDITHNPDWQVDCSDVIFLTSRREGPGLRWRYATPGGQELVIAVTAWYNGLGYEYYFVDGTPFRENKGRIRLQEIPEGTIVQWTFTYELGGLLGGMRNSLGMKRQVDQTIAESLKTLWQKIKQSSGAARTLEPKSLMRDAPDVEARSAYQPRHPSVVDMGEPEKPLRLAPTHLQVEPEISDEDAQPIRIFDEPPVVDDDTRPRSPFAPPAASRDAPEIEADFEPEFLDELAEFERSTEAEPDFMDEVDEDELWRFEPPRDPSDTQPRTVESLSSGSDAPPERTESHINIQPPNGETELLPVDYTNAELEQLDREAELETDPALSLEDVPTQASAPTDTPAPEQDLPDRASADVSEETGASIWEVFGVPRPSETQEIPQAEIDAAAEAPDGVPEAEAAEPEVSEEAVQPDLVPEIEAAASEPEPLGEESPTSETVELPPVPMRIGLRVVQRRKLIHLRRP